MLSVMSNERKEFIKLLREHPECEEQVKKILTSSTNTKGVNNAENLHNIFRKRKGKSIKG